FLPLPMFPLFPYTTLFRSMVDARLTASGPGLRSAERLEHALVGLRRLGVGRERRLVVIRPGQHGMQLFERRVVVVLDRRRDDSRSEEHTSELQSHLNLVCR